MDPEDQIKRAHRVQHELPETEAAMDAMRAEWIAGWADTAIDDVATREHLFHAVRALDALKSLLLRRVSDGIAAEHIVNLMNQSKVSNG